MKNILFLLCVSLFLFVSCGEEPKTTYGDTGNTANSADSANTANSADSANSGDTIDIGNTSNSANTSDSADTANSANSGDSANTSDSGDTADIDPEGDDDGDGIKNGVEAPKGVPVDTDSDGTPDYLDTDSDGDGIPDSVEGVEDTDGDGAVNYRDSDSDNDNIPDSVEAGSDPESPVDSDGDGLPDYVDGDSDGDGISDLYEGIKDADKDGMPNFLDTDSDGDTILDSEENGGAEPPLDSDDDKTPDFLDPDSDNDGLTDAYEASIGSNAKEADTDGDGFDDNVENAYGEQIDPDHTGAEYVLDPLLGIPEEVFYVILPYEEPETDKPLDFTTDIQFADILILVDLSGTMDGELGNLKSGINNTIISGINSEIPSAAFGLVGFGTWQEGPYALTPITTDAAVVTAAVNALSLKGGRYEPHAESLYQSATGEGFSATVQYEDCDTWGNCDWETLASPSIPAGTCAADAIGGACFRQDSLPIYIMITDEAFAGYDFQGESGVRWASTAGHTRAQAIAAMNDINAKFIGIKSISDQTDPTADYNAVSEGTNSKRADGSYYYYTIAADGTGLSTQVVDAVSDLVHNILMDVNTITESIDNAYGLDTTQFINAVIPNSTDPVEAYTSKDTTTFYGVTPGTTVLFDVTFQNNIYEPDTTEATLFRAQIKVRGQGTVLSTREVLIIVPGKTVGTGES